MSDLKANVEKVIGHEFPPIHFQYTERDVCLYALGIGAPADWLDQDELKFVYELSQSGFKALPTFAVLYPGKMIDVLVSGRIGDIQFNPMMLVHGEQYLEIKKPIPTAAKITCYPKVAQVYDKGSGMLMVTNSSCKDENGEEVAFTQSSMFIRGLGGFGGERGTSSNENVPPQREPDAVHQQQTLPQQALIYRLSGDINPLHADPSMAAIGGFDRPILHGLCTFGFVGRAVLKNFCNNDPSRFKSIRVRFSKHVFPGETLITEMWKVTDTKVIFQCKVAERNEYVLTHAAVELSG
ncbi:MAG: MaoC family dehydratase N-terminal domain-containing protein [Anaerolineae bacterium]|nr:MaoC family dehydratase N-terminal domain-containing protein [Anaerolineae bacterium]